MSRKTGKSKRLQLYDRGNVACPICLTVFTQEQACAGRTVTLEHVPPKSIGGQPRCLTCKPCNAGTGRNVDQAAALARQERVPVTVNIMGKRDTFVLSLDGKALSRSPRWSLGSARPAFIPPMVSFCLDQDRDGSAEEEADSDDQDKRSGSQHIKAQDPGTDAQNNHDGSRERPGVTDDQWTDSKGEDQECPAVVIPVLTQHYAMLQRNLLYTGVTRGKRLVVLVGQEKAVAIAVRNVSGRRRWSKLNEWLGDASGGDVGSRVAFSSSC